VTFVDAPLAKVRSAVLNQLKSFDNREVRLESIEISEKAFPVQVYNISRMSVLLFQPEAKAGGTVFFPNLQDGWHSLVHGLGKQEQLKCVSVRSSSDDTEWPIRELAIYENGRMSRLVRVMRDDPRWEFFESGDRLAFEDEASYETRLIRKRLPLSLLIEYCNSLGWPVDKGSFWMSDEQGVMIKWSLKTSNKD